MVLDLLMGEERIHLIVGSTLDESSVVVNEC